MNLKKVTFLAVTSLLLAGCSVQQIQQLFQKPEPISTTAPTESPSSIESQETAPVIEKNASPTPTASTSDEPSDMQKDLNSLKIESDFGALVQ